MDESFSVASSAGDSSGASDDFEILEPNASSSPVTTTPAAPFFSCVVASDNSSSSTGTLLVHNVDGSKKTLSHGQLSIEEPQLDIANNGNMEDLQKQMCEVLRDAESSSNDHITREDDPAILKSLDTSPESDFSSSVAKASVDAATTGLLTATAKPNQRHTKSIGLSHLAREAVEHNHPLSMASTSSSAAPVPALIKIERNITNTEKSKIISKETSRSQNTASSEGKNSSSLTNVIQSFNNSTETNATDVSTNRASISSSCSDSGVNDFYSSTTVPVTTPTIENPMSEDYTIFNQVLYLGAASISAACTQSEIMHNMGILNAQVKEQAIEVSLSVPSHSEGHVIIYDALNKLEITKYHINTIRKCTRGGDASPEASCFTFTTKHGTSPATSIVQCHVFRCQIPEAVGRIVDSFGAAFRRVPKLPVSSAMPATSSIAGASTCSTSDVTGDALATAGESGSTGMFTLQHMFDIALEIKEEDSKGNYYIVPRDKECFKIRCNVDKQVHITVTPSPTGHGSSTANVNGTSTNTFGNSSGTSSTGNCSRGGNVADLDIERCFGLLIAPGHRVKHADMNLLEMLSMGHSSNGGPPTTMSSAPTTSTNTNSSISGAGAAGGHGTSKSYVASGRWDPRDPVFNALNQETPKDGRVLMSVAVDLVMKGIQEPVRFVLDAKVRIFPQNERFWYFAKRPLLHLFALNLKQVDCTTSSTSSLDELQYEVTSVDNLGEVERLPRSSLAAGLTLPLTLSSLTSSTLSSLSGGMRSPSIASIDTPGAEEDTDDDEPLLSGSGEVSKDCPQSELDQWKQVLPKWQADPAHLPKGAGKLVRRGVPEALRGEVWQLLAGCSGDSAMMENYRILLTKECPSDQVILRDIHRTFPAHEFFKESGGGGQDALYKISRAYAVYDEELAYCQGLSFLAASLLLHMPEEQAFCLLVKIMSDYGFRNLFKDGFEVLHLRFYQLDKLMEDYLSDLHHHFESMGVATHMFASQWFLTLYTAKFPLYMVYHNLDLFLLMGFNSVFQVAIALLMMSRKELLSLDFEGVLKYFRVSLPKKYRSEDNVKQLFRLATSIKVKRLEKYQREYLAIKEQESGESCTERLEQDKRRLLGEKLRLDAENDMLARRIDQLEDVSERASREATALKLALAEADQEKTRLMLEASQVKELLKREVDRSDGQQQRSTSLVSEYKSICGQLSSRLENEHELHKKELLRIAARVKACKAAGCHCRDLVLSDEGQTTFTKTASSGDAGTSADLENSSISAAPQTREGEGQDEDTRRRARELCSLSNQVRELELELAQTKLALVETQCKNQDVTHQLHTAVTELQSSRNTWFQKTLTSISSLKERTTTGVTTTTTTGTTISTSRPISPTLSNNTVNSLSSLGSSAGGGAKTSVHRSSSVESNSSLSSKKDVS